MILSKLALHFWRPDFAPEQVKSLMGDYLEDLKNYSPAQIADACGTWRRDGNKKFFPTSGQLLAILRADFPSKHYRPPALASEANKPEPRKALRSIAEILKEHGHLAQI